MNILHTWAPLTLKTDESHPVKQIRNISNVHMRSWSSHMENNFLGVIGRYKCQYRIRTSGLSLLKVYLRVSLVSRMHCSEGPSERRASNTPKLRDFMGMYLKIWNHITLIWGPTVSIPFAPWCPWSQALTGLPAARPSIHFGFQRPEHLQHLDLTGSMQEAISS